MVDDDQHAKPGKGRGKRHLALVHRPGARALGGGDVDTISDDGGAETAGGRTAETGHDRAGDRPRQVAAEGTNGQRDGARRRAGSGECAFNLPLRGLQLADVLRREVALSIEAVDQPVARGDGRVERGARPACLLLRGLDRDAFLVEGGERGPFGGQCAPVRFEPHAVEFGHCRHAAAQPAEGADVIRCQQQLDVAAAASLRQFDQPFADPRRLRHAHRLERFQAHGGLPLCRHDSREAGLGLHHVLLRELTLDLELA